MDDVERFEKLKKRVDELHVKKLAADAEVKRLTEELETCKANIKSEYNVEIEDFAKAIDTMQRERARLIDELDALVSDAEEKLEVSR